MYICIQVQYVLSIMYVCMSACIYECARMYAYTVCIYILDLKCMYSMYVCKSVCMCCGSTDSESDSDNSELSHGGGSAEVVHTTRRKSIIRPYKSNHDGEG